MDERCLMACFYDRAISLAMAFRSAGKEGFPEVGRSIAGKTCSIVNVSIACH